MTEGIRRARTELRRWIGRGVHEPFDYLYDRTRDDLAGLEGRLGGELAALRAEVAAVHEQVRAEVGVAFRSEAGELARMLRQQGDAADEVAETLGRVLVRLSAEVETLSRAVETLQARSEPPAAAPEGALRRRGNRAGDPAPANLTDPGVASRLR